MCKNHSAKSQARFRVFASLDLIYPFILSCFLSQTVSSLSLLEKQVKSWKLQGKKLSKHTQKTTTSHKQTQKQVSSPK